MLENSQPLSPRLLFRVGVVLIVVLAFVAGFYHASLENEQKKYAKVEDMFVRVREQLGRTETQRLIDLSYEQ